ncbi:MAG TPA: 3-oxoadipate enol-lactonase [Candidatus Binatia bacterium]|jgi:3-oxoadipate enol-lactonase
MPFVQINNIVHRYVDHGSKSSPVMLFANSLGSDLRIWDDVASRLEGDFHVVRYDFRGHGLTDASEPPYSADGLAEDLARLLEILELHQAVVCGVSVGGLIAQAAALNYPERVLGLVLCDTGARIGSVQSWQQRIDLVQANGLESLENLTMERWFSASFRSGHPADVRGYAKMVRQTSLNGYIGTCCALRDADLRGAVERIKCPTLVACGSEDIATPPELGRELARLIPRAEFSLIENAAHLPCIEQPEALAKRILRFSREVQFV